MAIASGDAVNARAIELASAANAVQHRCGVKVKMFGLRQSFFLHGILSLSTVLMLSLGSANAETEPEPHASPLELPAWMVGVVRIDRRTDPEKYREFLERYSRKYPQAGMFPKKMAQVALPEEQLPRVISGHPRLMIRREHWKYGLGLAEVRERATRPPWVENLNRLRAKYASREGERKKLRWYDGIEAARYHLLTGDETIVPSLEDWLLAIPHAGYGLGGWPFIVYDWIYNALGPEQHKRIVAHLVRLARGAIELQEGGNCGDVWRHRGGGAVDPLVAGLALYGECPDGKELLRLGMGYYRAAILPAREHVDGAWLGGGHSYDGAEEPIPRALLCWASATEQDIFEVVRRDYGNWLENRMYFWMSQVYPDRTRSEVIGTDYAPWKLIVNDEEFLITSRAYRNPDGYRFLRWLGRHPQADLLLYDETLEQEPCSEIFSKPWAQLWGRHGTGYMQVRSRGWEPDSTVIEFRCGDYFESHGHYANQNSFYLYHRGRLILHTGIYDSFAKSEHWHNYYRRTIAANSVLIFQPGEFRVSPWGFIPEPGGQWPDTFGYRNFTQAEYHWHLLNEPHWYDMGNIVAFEQGEGCHYVYVCGDATMAYNNPRHVSYMEKDGVIFANRPKVDLFTRSLVYCPPGLLIVFDRVRALDPAYRKAWVIHSIGKPEISGTLLKAEVPGHIESFQSDLVTVTFDPLSGIWDSPDTNAVGRVFIRILLPDSRVVTRIGGDGYQFWSNGKNWEPGYEVWKPNKHGRGQDAGSWRVEVSPATPANFDTFLHVLHICTQTTVTSPAVTLIKAEEEKMQGAISAGWVVMFGRAGEVTGEIKYTVPEGRAEHLITDLRRGARYLISGTAGTSCETVASAEGTLRFRTTRAGTVVLTPQ
ncbi:MAG: heparinase II/III domain-containing protein [Kiritimatiellia bacterium]